MRWEYPIILSVFWETPVWVKKQQLESGKEHMSGSKMEKE